MENTVEDPSPAPKTERGGYRPGSGRKKQPYPDLAMRSAIHRVVADQIMPDMPLIVGALKSLALGTRAPGPGTDAGGIVYATPPDFEALAALLALVDRVS